MRIRIDGDGDAAREAQLALRVAGFVVVGAGAHADYKVRIDEAPIDTPIVDGVDGDLERLAVNRLEEHLSGRLTLQRAGGVRSEQQLGITIPPEDAARRGVSLALVEVFLHIVERRVSPRVGAVASEARGEAPTPLIEAQRRLEPQAALPSRDPIAELLANRLVDLSRGFGDVVRDMAKDAEAREAAWRAALDQHGASVVAMLGEVRAAAAAVRVAQQTLVAMTPPPPASKRSLWARLTGAAMLILTVAAAAQAQNGSPVTIRQGTNTAQVTASGELKTACTTGCTDTSDTDDGSVATGQSTGIGLNLSHVFDGSVWRRFTIGTAGTPSSQVLSVQGVSSMTPFSVSQSGTWTVQPGNTQNSTAWLVTGTGGTFPATQSGTWNIGTVTTVSAVTAISNALPAGDNDIGNVDLEIAGAAIAVNAGAASATTLRTVTASDSPDVTSLATVAGDTTDIEAAIETCSSASTHFTSSAASTNATSVKGSAGQLCGLEVVNTTSTLYYLRLYNLASAPTCSSATGFIRSVPIPHGTGTGAGIVSVTPFGQSYGTGIAFCFTGGGSSTDNTNAATGVYITLFYK